jgi:hypothetical protein
LIIGLQAQGVKSCRSYLLHFDTWFGIEILEQCQLLTRAAGTQQEQNSCNKEEES